MGAGKKGSFCLVAVYDDQDHKQIRRQQNEEEEEEDLEMIMKEKEEEEDVEASSSSSSSFNGSSRSGSSSSLDIVDDASSSSLSSLHSNEALYDLSELMSNLPIKRGLSKFYQGKSQSFTSLARVTSLEDLAKKPPNSCGGYGQRMKACKLSYGGGLNLSIHQQRSPYISSPKSAISKKYSSSLSSSLSSLRGKTTNRTSFYLG